MVQRFLFDRVDAESGTAAVGRRDDPSATVLPHETETAILLAQGTPPRAEIANELAPVVRWMPPAAALTPSGSAGSLGGNWTFCTIGKPRVLTA